MSVLLGLLGTGAIALLVLALFVRTDASALARGLRIAGPALVGILGVGLLLVGRVGVGGMLVSAAAAWYANGLRRTRPQRAPPGRSTVRTAALEMVLDHETGRLDGLVLAGRYEQKQLASLGLGALLELYSELYSDSESRQLLETYLDSRFPVWRENAQAGGGHRHGVAPGSGAMTKEEAYQILGLEAGATPADVRKAHRRLMQRLHPDVGGSSFLAARINEAKDILLTNHD